MTDAATAPAGAPVKPQRWGIGDALAGWVIVQLIAAVWGIAVLAGTGHAGEEFDDLPLTVLALAQLGLSLAFLGVPWAVTRLKGNGPVADLGIRARRADLWQGGLLGLAAQLVVVPLVYWPLLELLGKDVDDLGGPAESLTDRAHGATGVVLLVLIVGILAPVFEEIFYRGLVQRSLLKRGLHPVVAIGISSLAFGLAHFQLLQLPGLVLAGALFGTLAYRADRLGPAIAAHLTFNLVTVIGLLVTA